MGAPCSQCTQDWPLASPETSHSQCQVTPLGTAVPLAHSTSRRCHVEAAQRPCPPVCVTVKSTRLGKKKPLFCVGLKFPTWQACKVITKYYASPFQGQHYFSLAKRVRILGVRSVQKCASVPVLLGARRQAAANSLATPVPRSPATKKFRNCAQEGYYLCKQWSPCVASAFAYSSRSPHPDQRGWPGHRAKWPRRRWRRTQGASDHDCTRRAHIYENC